MGCVVGVRDVIHFMKMKCLIPFLKKLYDLLKMIIPDTSDRPNPTTDMSVLIVSGPFDTKDVFRIITNGINIISKQIAAPARDIEKVAMFFNMCVVVNFSSI
jgi:hypothetical protein